MARAAAKNAPRTRGSNSPLVALPTLTRIRSRYTRFVGTMKLILPLVAGILITMVIAWPQMGDQPATLQLAAAPVDIEATEGGQRVVNARFRGVDRNDQPYVLTADEAMQPNRGSNRVQLRNPRADIKLNSGEAVAASAPHGVYSTKDSVLTLDGGIKLSQTEGNEFRTKSATIDLEKGVARGADPVFGAGPFGSLAARGFLIFDEGRHFLFTGKSKLVLKNKPGGNKR